MKKIIRLFEPDLIKIITKNIYEQNVVKQQSKNKEDKWDRYNQSIKSLAVNNLKTESSFLSRQVRKQLNYMLKNNILLSQKFTILDDRNSQVYTFDPGFKFIKKYNVITGEKRGDDLVTQTALNYVKENPMVVIKSLGQGATMSDKAKWIKNEFLNKVLPKNTAAGIFKRGGIIQDFFNNAFLTWMFPAVYGKQYITWTTLDGKTIPYGFHGTGDSKRLKVLGDPNSLANTRKMSYGCINFLENDIKEINNFINYNQISIWLPENGDIQEFPENFGKPTRYEKHIQSPKYMNPGKI